MLFEEWTLTLQCTLKFLGIVRNYQNHMASHVSTHKIFYMHSVCILFNLFHTSVLIAKISSEHEFGVFKLSNNAKFMIVD